MYDPRLMLSGAKLLFAGNKPVRLVGGVIQVPNNPDARPSLHTKLESLLRKRDQIPVTRKQNNYAYL